MLCHHRLPGFRATCVGVAVLYVAIAAWVLGRGVAATMTEYQVPAQTLASAHYVDAIEWVYVHTAVLGLLIGAIGLRVTEARAQRGFARLLLAAQLVYLFLDVRTSDSALGNGLYEGPSSLGPAIIGLVVTLLFLHLSFCAPSSVADDRGGAGGR